MRHANAVVEADDVPDDVVIHPFAVVRAGVVLGPGCIVHPHVVIERGCRVGPGVEIFPGAVIGKEPRSAGALARPLEFERGVRIGAGSVIGCHAVLYQDVEVGENTMIGDGASVREQCRIGSRVVVGRYVTLNYAVEVGDGTKIMDHSWLAGNMTVGEDVFISGGVLTANDNRIGTAGYSATEVVGPTIASGARIGVGAILLPGITIGRDATVGAGALATRDVADGSRVMGMPARPVRTREDPGGR